MNLMNAKHIIVILFIVCLQGCSSKFAYNNADWLSNWYIDDYLDLNTDQNRILKKELSSVLEWHRDTQLSEYKILLLELSNDLNILPITQEKWLLHFNTVINHWHHVRKEISLRSAKLAPLLNEQQVDYLFKKLHQKNQRKLNDFNEQSLEEYRATKFENMKEAIEDKLGSISAQQQEYALEFTANAAITEQEWFDSKVDLQKAMKDAFKNNNSEAMTAQLYELMINPDQFKSKSLLDAYAINRELLVNMLHKISGSLSAEQVIHFKNEIDELVQLIDSITVKN